MNEPQEPLIARLFAQLSDGQFHSGQELAAELGVSRSAVWKAARALRALGATIHAVRNRGYRLPSIAEPLNAQKIRELLPQPTHGRVRRVETTWTVASTNTVLMERANPPVGSSEVLLAEYQTAGRGRRGRTWVAPPGGAICLSMSWVFGQVPRDLGALGLVVGVCAQRSLTRQGVQDLQLKWPNDLVVGGRKLGGILIELRAESAGPACVVIGIGLNVALGASLLQKIAGMGLDPIDLVTAGKGLTGGSGLSRNALAAGLVSALVAGLIEFERGGLKPFVQEWLGVDALRGKPVTVTTPEGMAKGIARGIDLDGALLVETPGGLLRFISGDASVRAES